MTLLSYRCNTNDIQLCNEIDGKRRILKALSSFWKGEVEIELFVNAYHAILMDEYINNIYPRYFSDEGMALVGLKNRKDM